MDLDAKSKADDRKEQFADLVPREHQVVDEERRDDIVALLELPSNDVVEELELPGFAPNRVTLGEALSNSLANLAPGWNLPVRFRNFTALLLMCYAETDDLNQIGARVHEHAPRDCRGHRMSRITLLEELRDSVVVLTLNRPKRRNAFNDQQYDDLRGALAEAQANDEVRVAVITGAPGAFSAGQDIDEMGSGSRFIPFVDQLVAFDKPLLAAVNGVGVGIGITMLPHCDIVYMAESARLRAPFVALGLVPEAGSTLLMQMVMGPQRAAEVLFSAQWINARQAFEWGLAAHVVPDQELLSTVLAKAAEIAVQPLVPLRETKRLLRAARADALQAARVREDTAQMSRLGSPENLAAIRAFRQKRSAR